ncbi:cytidine deaminase [Chamaesiphon minutus]|uniref:Cytidine deaminase n=1 Tax=Chamaesiphon minutus (strain ATCC 27169 / PCC 6605) TaxID=1173020 RepID=K9UA17_CHAP6|nr:cytidine deaminase [Chamaesiphon minutus]AFY91458.1 cytidine deaminase [Chamaesiphon minutus PCC 6605]
MSSLSSIDRELIEQARSIISKRFKQDYHHIGAALRTKSGRVFAAVHLEANVGRVAVCAEAIAIGMAAAVGDTELETIVAVDPQGNIVSPCGMCRELISDYAPDCQTIISEQKIVTIGELLPHKYQRID